MLLVSTSAQSIPATITSEPFAPQRGNLSWWHYKAILCSVKEWNMSSSSLPGDFFTLAASLSLVVNMVDLGGGRCFCPLHSLVWLFESSQNCLDLIHNHTNKWTTQTPKTHSRVLLFIIFLACKYEIDQRRRWCENNGEHHELLKMNRAERWLCEQQLEWLFRHTSLFVNVCQPIYVWMSVSKYQHNTKKRLFHPLECKVKDGLETTISWLLKPCRGNRPSVKHWRLNSVSFCFTLYMLEVKTLLLLVSFECSMQVCCKYGPLLLLNIAIYRYLVFILVFTCFQYILLT